MANEKNATSASAPAPETKTAVFTPEPPSTRPHFLVQSGVPIPEFTGATRGSGVSASIATIKLMGDWFSYARLLNAKGTGYGRDNSKTANIKRVAENHKWLIIYRGDPMPVFDKDKFKGVLEIRQISETEDAVLRVA